MRKILGRLYVPAGLKVNACFVPLDNRSPLPRGVLSYLAGMKGLPSVRPPATKSLLSDGTPHERVTASPDC